MSEFWIEFDLDHPPFDLLRERRTDIVPVVGAGISMAAGGPSSADLLDAIRTAAREEGLLLPPGLGLMAAANALEGLTTAGFVQDVVAARTSQAALTTTPTLFGLARTPSQLIVTTNYDLAIEKAIFELGLNPVTFTAGEANLALANRLTGSVHVLHLHGVVNEPGSIVLTDSTYASAGADEGAQMALRQLASEWLLLFLGQSLSTGEVDIRAELQWVKDRFHTTSSHLLLERDPGLAPAGGVPPDAAGVVRIDLPDRGRPYAFTEIAAMILGGAPRVEAEADLPVCESVASVYVPIPVASESEASTEIGLGAHEYRRYSGTAQTAHDLDHIGRLLLIGRPGYGKSDTLAQIAKRSPDHAIVIPFRTAHNPGPDDTAFQVFLGWAENASAGRTGVPHLTEARFLAEPWTFCLDGLDEIRADRRAGVLAVVTTLASNHTQHRWVISSRRAVDTHSLTLAGFERYVLLPDWRWLNEFVSKHAVAAEVVRDRIAALPKIASLVTIPRYAAEIVKNIADGVPMPTDPLGLTLSLLDRALTHESPRLPISADDVKAWLGDLAFAFEALGEREVERAQIPYAGLTDDGIDRLVERTLLIDDDGAIAFPADIAQEARAAERLLRHPSGPVLARKVAVQEVVGAPTVRPAWRHTLDFLLDAGGDDWRDALRPVDPMGVARSIGPDSAIAVREEAATLIWTWYVKNAVHLPVETAGLHDDVDALRRLTNGSGLPGSLVTQVEAGITSPDSATRGNAVLVLAQTGHCDVLSPYLTTLLGDDNSVVRRRVALATVECGRSDLAAALVEAARTDSDELARRTLTEAAVTVVDDAHLSAVLNRVPRRSRREAFSVVHRRRGRTPALNYIIGLGSVDSDLLEEVADGSAPWTANEVALLGEALALTPDEWMGRHTRTVLTASPAAALRGRLRRPVELHEFWRLGSLFDLLSDDELAELTAHDPDTEELLSEYRDHRRSSSGTPAPAPTTGAAPPGPALADLIGSADDSVLLAHQPSSTEVAELPAAQRQRLTERVQAVWQQERQEGRSPALLITRRGNQFEGPRSAWRLRDWAALARVAVSREEWIALAGLGLASEVTEWLHEQFEPSFEDLLVPRIRDAADEELEGLLRAVPQPWSVAIAETFADRAVRQASTELALRLCVAALVDGRGDVLRAAAAGRDDPIINRALVEVGDCDAERRLLEADLAEVPRALTRMDEKEQWLADVRCAESAPLIEESVRRLLAAGNSVDDVTGYLRALDRSLGVGAVDVYDRLMADPALPGARWLWYNRQRCIDGLSERLARERLPNSVESMVALLQ